MTDRVFREPRRWSNRELRKFGPLFSGSVINVSGWLDSDKEGDSYRSYFPNAREYVISNWGTEVRGYQGKAGEILLDLETPIPDDLRQSFDVVFNHTTLEHVFDLFTAFANLCELARDAVIVIVPFAQEHHPADFGDYWRFTPQALERLFQANELHLAYVSGMNEWNTASYVFAIGVRDAAKWRGRFPPLTVPDRLGSAHVRENSVIRGARMLRRVLRRFGV